MAKPFNELRKNSKREQRLRDERKQQKVFDILMEQGFLIGSRAWGGHKDGSDYDLIIDEAIFEKIMLACKHNSIYVDEKRIWGFSANMDEHNMFNTLNIMLAFPEGQELNVIAYREQDLPMIWDAHQAMMALKDTAVGKKCAENKAHRIEIFQACKDVAFEKKVAKMCKCVGFSHQHDCPEYLDQFNPDEDIPF